MTAVDALHRLNAVKRLQQTLRKDPRNIAALLEMARLADTLKEPDLKSKRILLNRVLSLDPANQTAREMLLDMDRAEMGGLHVQSMTPILPVEGSPIPASLGSQTDPLEAPLVFRYSIWLQFLIYAFIAFTMYVSWQMVQQGDPEVLLVAGAFLLVLIIPLWFISVVVEVSDLEIRFSRLFGVARWEFPWQEIQELRSNALGGINILTKEGQVLELSAQIGGYPSLVEILRRKRPDLFGVAEASSLGNASTGSRTFEKSALAKYAPLFLVIAGSLFSSIALLATAQCLGAILGMILLFLLWKFALNTPYFLKIEGNKLSMKSFSKKQELTAGQIKDIQMVTRYGRRGIKRTHVHLELLDGPSFILAGFSGGDELMYGFLKSWWSAHQNT